MLFVSGQADCPDVKLEGGHFKWNLEGEVKLEREGGKSCCCRKKTAPEEPKEKEGKHAMKRLYYHFSLLDSKYK